MAGARRQRKEILGLPKARLNNLGERRNLASLRLEEEKLGP